MKESNKNSTNITQVAHAYSSLKDSNAHIEIYIASNKGVFVKLYIYIFLLLLFHKRLQQL
jgi:hypothetical protein